MCYSDPVMYELHSVPSFSFLKYGAINNSKAAACLAQYSVYSKAQPNILPAVNINHSFQKL